MKPFFLADGVPACEAPALCVLLAVGRQQGPCDEAEPGWALEKQMEGDTGGSAENGSVAATGSHRGLRGGVGGRQLGLALPLL